MNQLLKTIAAISETHNPALRILVLTTMFNKRQNLDKLIRQQAHEAGKADYFRLGRSQCRIHGGVEFIATCKVAMRNDLDRYSGCCGVIQPGCCCGIGNYEHDGRRK